MPQNKLVKQPRTKYSLHDVQALIANEDSCEELAGYDDLLMKGDQHKVTSVESVDAVMQCDKEKSQLNGRRRKYKGSDSSEEHDDDVEPDDSSDFCNQLTTDVEVYHRKDCNRDYQARRNKLSLKKPNALNRNQEYIDSRDGRHANSPETKNLQSFKSLMQTSDKDLMMAEKSSAGKWLSKEDMEDWDHIEYLSDSDSGEPALSHVQPMYVETQSHTSKMVSYNVDKRHRAQTRQPVKSITRPSKMLKYCDGSDLVDANIEITVDEDNTDEADEDLILLTGCSPAATSEKGRMSSKKLTGLFFSTSPGSRKSGYDTDDNEFVSNSTYHDVRLLLLCCVSVVDIYVYILDVTNWVFQHELIV